MRSFCGRSMFGWLACGAVAWVASAMVAAGSVYAEPQPSGDAWTFTLGGQTVAYVRQADGDWFFVQPGKPHNVLQQLERTREQVILQNRKTKLFIKLTPDRAYWRQPNQDNWTTYVKGSFTRPPESLMASIEKPANRMPAQPAVPPTSKPNGTSVAPGAPLATTVPSEATGTQRPYQVKVAYFVPQGREPVANWEAKIRVIIHYVDSIFRNDLQRKGYDTPGLSWEQDRGRTKVHFIRGEHAASHYAVPPTYDDGQQFSRVAQEVHQRLGKRSETLTIVFCDNYSEQPSDLLWDGVLALGAYHSAGGGLAMFSAHLLRDEFCATTVAEQIPKFFDRTPVPGRRAHGHAMNSPRAEFVEDGFGAVAHELGHALGLPHDFRDQDRYIMSNGFRQIARNLSRSTPASNLVTFSDDSARLLMSSRYLNPRLSRTDDTRPEVQVQVFGRPRKGADVTLEIQAADRSGLRAYVVFDRNAGSIITGGTLSGEEAKRRVSLQPVYNQKGASLEVIVTDNGGNQQRVRENISWNGASTGRAR